MTSNEEIWKSSLLDKYFSKYFHRVFVKGYFHKHPCIGEEQRDEEEVFTLTIYLDASIWPPYKQTYFVLIEEEIVS